MRLYLTNLPPDADAEELAEFFGPLGDVAVTLVWVVTVGPVGVLTLPDTGRVPDLNGVWLRGHFLAAATEPPRARGAAGDPRRLG